MCGELPESRECGELLPSRTKAGVTPEEGDAGGLLVCREQGREWSRCVCKGAHSSLCPRMERDSSKHDWY